MRDLVECDFYALWNHDGSLLPVLRHGVSDGQYFYYELDGTCYAIVPECGRAIASAYRLDDCIYNAYDKHTALNVQRELESGRWEKYALDFEQICLEHGIDPPGSWAAKVGSLSELLSM